jgi:hypothetical protein
VSDSERLIALLESFHITDRSLLRWRDKARVSGDPGAAAALKREMRRYFGALEREALAQVSSLDGKLDELYQRQYNLQAEHAVAQRRLSGSRKVLAALKQPTAEEAS